MDCSLHSQPPKAVSDSLDNVTCHRSSADRPREKFRQHRWLIWMFKASVALLLLGWLVWSDRMNLENLTRLAPSFGFVGFCTLVLFSMLLPAIRWWYLLRIQKLDAPLWRTMRLSWFAYLVGTFTPGLVGGDVLKAFVVLKQQADGRGRALSTVFLDRLLGLLGLLFLGTVSALWMVLRNPDSRPHQQLAFVTVGLFATALTSFLLAAWSRTQAIFLPLLPSRWRPTVGEAISLYSCRWPAVLLCAALSVVAHAIAFLALFVASVLLRHEVTVGTIFQTAPLIHLANYLPITPGGLGVGEAAGDQLLSSFGFEGGAEIVFLVRLTTIAMCLPVVVYGKLRTDQQSRDRQQAGVHLAGSASE